MTMLIALVVVALIAVGIFVAAVWFGQRIIAPPIQRALDRSDEDEPPGD